MNNLHPNRFRADSETAVRNELDPPRDNFFLRLVSWNVMAFCRAYVGENATIASEVAVLGVPTVYATQTRRGYTAEPEERYGLVRNIHHFDGCEIRSVFDMILNVPCQTWAKVWMGLLNDTVDVAAYGVKSIKTLPAPLQDYLRVLAR